MTPEERNLITGLFTRLKSADSPQKDQEAEQLIQQSTATQPTAPYLLVQTVLVQEHALSNAQARIQQLEKQVAEASATASQQGQHKEGGVGGFLSGLFGGQSTGQGSTVQPQAGQPPSSTVPPQRLPQAPGQGYAQQAPPQGYAQPAPPPYPSTVGMQPSAGGSFLKSALGTAAGVAGGAALFAGIESLLGHNSGPFGGGGFGHSGFFGGGGFGGGGYGGPEAVENREVVNNYYDERGNDDRGGNSSFLGGQGVGAGQQEDNRRDDANTNTNDGGNSGLYSTPPTDDVADSGDSGLYSTPPTDDNGGNTDDGLYSTPPTDDDSGSMDNSYDSGSSDAGGGDDSSYV